MDGSEQVMGYAKSASGCALGLSAENLFYLEEDGEVTQALYTYLNDDDLPVISSSDDGKVSR